MNSERFHLETLPLHLGGDIDLFVCAASYESRCRSIPDTIPLNSIRRALIAEAEHSHRYTTDNGQYLRDKFGTAGVHVLLNPSDPVETADAIQAGLREASVPAGGQVYIDVTTFTHEALLILVGMLPLVLPPCRVRFIYVSAAEYSVGDSDENKWLSKGISEVRSVLGYAGEIVPSRKQHLIVLVGFEHERAAGLIKQYEPSVITLGHGRAGTATNQKHEAANLHFHKLVYALASTYGEVRKFEFSCNDPFDVRTAIGRQTKGFKAYNTIVAPMNTKLSTLGAVLAARGDHAIQLCYVRPMQYNYKAYSRAGDQCYVVELPELFAERGGGS